MEPFEKVKLNPQEFLKYFSKKATRIYFKFVPFRASLRSFIIKINLITSNFFVFH